MTTTGAENIPRDGKGKFVRRLSTAERDGEACKLFAQGWRIREISDHLGYGSPGNCHRGIQRALAEAASLHGARDLRELQIEELTELRKRMWALVNTPPPAFDRMGHLVRDDDGNPVPDAAAVTNAASVIVRCAERLGRLTGTDAPKRSVSVLANVSTADLQAHMAELRAELGIPDDGPAARAAIRGTVADSGDAA